MNAIIPTFVSAINNIILFIPRFLSGLILLIVGLIVASIAKAVVERVAQYLNLGQWFSKANIESRGTTRMWTNILSQVVYWFILISFLIPTFDAWQLPSITGILNRFVLYLPNVFAAAVIGFFGVIIANIVYQTVSNASSSLGARVQLILSNVTRYSIIFFAALMALNQLGISPNLIQILLTGFVSALAIAIGLGLGLSVGLGGRETVRNTLDSFVNSQGLAGIKGGQARMTDKNKSSAKNNKLNKKSNQR